MSIAIVGSMKVRHGIIDELDKMQNSGQPLDRLFALCDSVTLTFDL